MIVGIEGTVEYKEPTAVHLNVSGLIYEVFISLQTYGAIREPRVKLHTSHIIREDAQLLFGFFEKSEKVLFERLIKISGVGPKVAQAICSTFTPPQFGQADGRPVPYGTCHSNPHESHWNVRTSGPRYSPPSIRSALPPTSASAVLRRALVTIRPNVCRETPMLPAASSW